MVIENNSIEDSCILYQRRVLRFSLQLDNESSSCSERFGICHFKGGPADLLPKGDLKYKP